MPRRGFVVLVRYGPVGCKFRLAQRLLLPSREPLGERGAVLRDPACRDRAATLPTIICNSIAMSPRMRKQRVAGSAPQQPALRDPAGHHARPFGRAYSLRTARRARTSSPRLWSCVAVASIACGKSAWRRSTRAWKSAGLIAEHVGLEADIVAREQSSVAIERSVLDRLRGDRCAELLELRDGAVLDVRGFRVARMRTEPRCQRSTTIRSAGRQVARGTRDRRLKERPVARGTLARRRVGAIDGKMRQQLGQGAAQRCAGNLCPFEVRKAVEARHTGLELRRETARDDLAPRRILLDREIGSCGRTPNAQSASSGALPRAIMLHRADVIHEVVAAGAVARPVCRQAFRRAAGFSRRRCKAVRAARSPGRSRRQRFETLAQLRQ